ncbi:MAG: hypothetical protein DPW16_11845 [Chloroflexi bacterium]|nr:hypothetical protein [Chloroflexota bacterium]
MDQPQNLRDPNALDELEISGFLAEIMENIRQQLEINKQEISQSGLHALTSIQRRALALSSVLRYDRGLSLIVELKRQSHRGKTLVDRYDPVEQAHLFENLGVQALSVATNPLYYQGEIHHLTLVSQETRIPVIRNDFVFDRYQVHEARAAGADAVILIAALLGEYRLWDLVSITQRLRMTAVVQVQNEQELARTLKSDPLVIAISNVDWRTFDVDLSRTTRLCPQIPRHIVVVSMGGIRTPEDMAMVAESGIDGVVVGEGLLGVPNPEEAIHTLFSLVNPDNRAIR